MERARARYGKRFTIRLLAAPPFVILSEPDQLKELFAAPPDVLHPGEGAGILEPVVGKNSRDPPRRGGAPGAAQADAPGLPRREDAAPLRTDGRRRRARDRELAARSAAPLHPLLPGADAGDHPARRLRPRPRAAAWTSSASCSPRSSSSAPSPPSLLPQLQRGYFGRGPWVALRAACASGPTSSSTS